MPPLYIAALAAALAAFAVLCINLADGWYFGLLALSCLLAALFEAFEERDPFAACFLTGAAVFAALAVRSAVRDRRDGETP